MAKLKQLVVTVEGVFRFPIDMLRYDNLTPYDSSDAAKIVDSAAGHVNVMHSVKLQGWVHGSDGGPSRVTQARWDSFGWKATEVLIDGKPQRVYKP